MNEHSKLLTKTLGFVFPFILVFGVYMISNGHISPGGGFQGGAVMASVFICKYLIDPMKDVSLYRVQWVEKLALLFIILLALGFVATGLNVYFSFFLPYYLIIMNILIGLKVACGMTIIFYRFVYYESR
jgi:multicomponent Na+:H+ antiporter subunit B